LSQVRAAPIVPEREVRAPQASCWSGDLDLRGQVAAEGQDVDHAAPELRIVLGRLVVRIVLAGDPHQDVENRMLERLVFVATLHFDLLVVGTAWDVAVAGEHLDLPAATVEDEAAVRTLFDGQSHGSLRCGGGWNKVWN